MGVVGGRFGKVFRVVAVIGAVVATLLLVAYLQTDVPMYLGRYDAVREKARAAGFQFSQTEVNLNPEYARELALMATVPEFVIPKEVKNTYGTKEKLLAEWDANKKNFPLFRSALAKMRVTPVVAYGPFPAGYMSMVKWQTLLRDKAKLAVVVGDYVEAERMLSTASDLGRIEGGWCYGFGRFEQVFFWLLRTHWDDPKWLDLAEKTIDQMDMAIDFEWTHQFLHAISVEVVLSSFAKESQSAENWKIRTEGLIPKYKLALSAGIHSIYLDTLPMLPKSHGDRPTPIAELERSARLLSEYRKTTLDAAKRHPWKLVSQRMAIPIEDAVSSVQTVSRIRRQCATLRAAIAWLRAHPKRDAASEATLNTMLGISSSAVSTPAFKALGRGSVP